MLQDIRFAVRSFAKGPASAVVAILTLALGIGATTAIFSVVHGAFVRPLPFPNPNELVMVYLKRTESGRAPDRSRWSHPEFEMLKRSASKLDGIASFGRGGVNLTGVDLPLRVESEVATASYFSVLRVRAVAGRTFAPEEDEPDASHAVALIGYGLWQRLFAGSPDTVGKTIRLNNVPVTIVGILPDGFGGLSGAAEVWIPKAMAPVVTFPGHFTSLEHFMNIVARIQTGATLSEANAELDVLGQRIASAFPHPSNVPASWSATAIPLDTVRVDPVQRRAQLILFGAVGFVLVIACVNIANLMLSRAAGRRREIAVRRAMGSSRWRLIRQLLTESVLLALVGGAVGVLFAFWATDILTQFVPERIPSPSNDYAQLSDFASIRIDTGVLVFSFVLSVATGILFGLVPAIQATKSNLTHSLKEGVRGSERRGRTFGVLVVTEFALALALLVGAALMLESFSRLQAAPVGFNPVNVLTFYLQPRLAQYPEDKAPALLERVLEQVSAVPGVESATVDLCTPLMTTGARTTLRMEGTTGQPPGVGRHYVGPDHFRTLGIPLMRGRVFTAADRIGRPSVAIVSEAGARRFWPSEDPIGKRVRFGSNAPFGAADQTIEIVGIVGDVKYGPPEEAAGPQFYTPYFQFSWPFGYVMVKSAVDPAKLIPEMRRAVAAVDPGLPIDNIKTMEERANTVTSRARFSTLLLAIFAAMALMLASVGIYGVMSHSVSVRIQEIGIRVALGAEPGTVVRLIAGEGLMLASIGVVVGVLGALGLTRVLRSQLFEVSSAEPRTFLAMAFVLLVMAALACYFPARRATRVDPAITLRQE